MMLIHQRYTCAPIALHHPLRRREGGRERERERERERKRESV